MTEPETPRLLTVAEACNVLRIGKVKFYELLKAGELGDSVRMPSPTGKRPARRVREADVIAFMERHTEPAAASTP